MGAAGRRVLPRAGGVVLGEVTTALLDQHVPLTLAQTKALLHLVPGPPIEVRAHPLPRAVSRELIVGVDCPLVHGASELVHGIGSVRARAVLTGGHVVQGSARATVQIDGSGIRRGWGHYTARPGVIEVIDAAHPDELVDGFLTAGAADGRPLNLGAVGAEVLQRIGRDETDSGARLRTRRTGLRWAVRTTGGVASPSAEFRPGPDGAWWIRLSANPEEVEAVTDFCEDVALHLWLLTALHTVCDRSIRNPDAQRELGPALRYLVHLWLPGAHLSSEFRRLWQHLEDTAGVEREWRVLVARVRDRLMAHEQ